MRKYLSLLLAMVMVAALVTGCGDDTTGTGSSGLTKIRVWTGDTGSRIAYEQAVHEFNQTTGKEKGIEVVYEAKENSGSAIPVALQTGQEAEIFMQGDVAEYVDKGYLMPIEDLPNGAEIIDKRKDFLLEGKQIYKGKTYSIPYAATTYGFVYNKDMFREAGLVDENGEPTPPKTYDEVREYAKRLTDTAKGQYGIVFPLKWGDGLFSCDILSSVTASSGTDGFDYTTGQYDYSEYEAIFEMYLGIKEDKSYMPGAEGLDNDAARARFAEGNIGMKWAVSWDVGVFNDQFPAKCDWGVAPLPVEDPSKSYYQHMGVNTGFKISAKAAERVGMEKLAIVYEWLNSDELARRIYELGANLPLDFSVTEGVDESALKTGWVEFAEMAAISKVLPPKPSTDISGETTFSTDFFNSVWPGKMTSVEAIEKANRVMNEGIARYAEIHPETDPASYIIPDWSMAR